MDFKEAEVTAKNLFPNTTEVKRLIAAVQRTGVDIECIEIEPARIRIFSDKASKREPLSAYDEWKRREAINSQKREAGR